jgi:kinetochore protein Nuf2
MAAAVVYSFPLLQPPDISTCLSELGINFSEAALTKPEPEPVAKLFEELVVSQMGVTRCAAGLARAGATRPALTGSMLLCNRDELQQPVFAALDALTYPELHEESVGVIAFTRHLHRLVRTAGITDFSMKACFAPAARLPAAGCAALTRAARRHATGRARAGGEAAAAHAVGGAQLCKVQRRHGGAVAGAARRLARRAGCAGGGKAGARGQGARRRADAPCGAAAWREGCATLRRARFAACADAPRPRRAAARGAGTHRRRARRGSAGARPPALRTGCVRSQLLRACCASAPPL